MKNLIPTIIILLFTAVVTGLYSQDAYYAQHLYKQQDYYRSISEWKKVLYYSEDSKEKENAQLMISRCYYESGLFTEAIGSTASLLQSRSLDGPSRAEAFSLLAFCYYRMHNFVMTDQYIHSAEEADSEPDADLWGLRIMLLIIAGHYSDALGKINSNPQIPGIEAAENASVQLQAMVPLRKKSPVAAGVLSALLPGTGQFYSGHPVDGIQAFLMNVSMGIATTGLFLFEKESKIPHIASGISLFLSTGFYTANIYGASKTAGYYTLKQKQDLIHAMEKLLLQLNFTGSR